MDLIEGEEPLKVLSSSSREIFKFDLFKLCQKPRRMNHKAWLVSFSAKWLRRQKWTISLDQKLVKRYDLRRLPQILGFLERNVTGERDQKTDLQ